MEIKKLKIQNGFTPHRFCFKSGGGFTLIEMLVAAVIFLIIVVAITGIFVSALRTQRYTLASQRLLDQSSYVMEYMSRALRMAKKDVDNSCLEGNKLNYKKSTLGRKGIRFVNYRKECQEFYLKDGRIYQKIGAEDLPLTSDSFYISSLEFEITGENQMDKFQPRVTISLEMEGKEASPQPKINLQTTISQRDLDTEE